MPGVKISPTLAYGPLWMALGFWQIIKTAGDKRLKLPRRQTSQPAAGITVVQAD
jgi:hypothetical protein